MAISTLGVDSFAAMIAASPTPAFTALAKGSFTVTRPTALPPQPHTAMVACIGGLQTLTVYRVNLV